MKRKLVLVITLLFLALFMVACSTPRTTADDTQAKGEEGKESAISKSVDKQAILNSIASEKHKSQPATADESAADKDTVSSA
ncbi:hypothetical protein, partial [Kaarinaea lacus]